MVGHWAKENIEFVVSCGLFGGTSNTIFSPNTAMTRGNCEADTDGRHNQR
ncbi:S-layer homology domain-containing protein [Cellulosilyticum lentocellum]